MNKRIEWIDATKGIGILLVMLSHLCILPNHLCDGYIPLFFLAAGLTYKPRTFREDICAKAKRLLIPYTFYSGVIIGCNALYSLIRHTFNLHEFVVALFGGLYARVCIEYPWGHETTRLLTQNAPMWFLPCMFFVYLLSSWYVNSNRKKVVLAGSIIAVFAVQEIPYQLSWSIDLAIMGFLFLLTGLSYKELIFKTLNTPPYIQVASADNSNQIKWNLKMTYIVLNTAIICFLLTVYYFLSNQNGRVNMSVRNYGELGYISLPVFYVLGCLYFQIVSKLCYFIEGTFISRFLSYIGKQSLRLMCIHLLIVGYSAAIVLRTPMTNHLSEGLIAVIYIVIILAINYTIDRFLMSVQQKFSIIRYI